MISTREIEILRFVNEFGFCEIRQIMKQFCIKQSRCYQIMQSLEKKELVRRQSIFYGRPGIYRLSRKGASYTDLPALTKIPLAHYGHQLAIVDVCYKLRLLYPEASWVSERRLIQEKFSEGLGKRGHLSDGMLIFSDQSQVAIEIELAVKAKTRLQKILRSYNSQFVIKEVWYFCSKAAASALTPLVINMPFIKIYSINEFLK